MREVEEQGNREAERLGCRFFRDTALVAFGFCLMLLAVGGGSVAQDFDRIAPRTPPSSGLGEIEGESSPEAVGEDGGQELLDRLEGLVFVPRPEEVREAGRPGVQGVLVDGVALMDQDEWSTRLSERIGAPLSMGGLHAIMREIVLHYRDEGRPVVDVVVVEQDITSGVVQLAVVEARLGEVRAEGAKWFKAERLAGLVRLEPDGPILSTLLLSDLAWLNRNPFRSVDLVYVPGGEVGETDVVLRIDDSRPLRLYGGGEDTGNTLTGSNRWFAGVNYGNLWGIDHQVNYQWTFNERTDLLSAHSMSYVAPLPWRHIATVYAAYVESSAKLPPPFDLFGETAQLSGRYTIPLPASPEARGVFEHELEFGYDFKHSTSNLEFGVLGVSNVDTDVQQFVFGYRASLRDKGGLTRFEGFGYTSPGGMGGGNDDASFALARAGAESSYSYGTLELERLQRLPSGFTAVLGGGVQFADGNLLPSEQLGLGGYDSVRGYEEHEINVDRGYSLGAELRTPSLAGLLPGSAWGEVLGQSDLQLLVFVDHGAGRSVDRLPGEPRRYSLTSVGPGLRWTVGEHFSFRFDYGFQLEDSGAGLGLGDSRMHIGGVLAY